MKILVGLKQKINQPVAKMVYLSFLSGIFLTLGAGLFGLITTFNAGSLGKLLGAISFSVGLILVVFRKTQLFTGNNLMILGLIEKSMRLGPVLRNWLIVYLGNFIGAIAGVIVIKLVFMGNASVLGRFLEIAELKVGYGAGESFLRGIFCNYLVCLAVYLGIVLKTTISRVIGIVIPISLFVYMGFEHSIANMIFIPTGLSQVGFSTEQWSLFLGNLIPVTLGNIVGGAFLCLSVIFLSKYKVVD